MLKIFQIACLVVVALDISLLTLWGLLTDRIPLLSVGVFVATGYCVFVSRLVSRTPNAFLVSLTRRVSIFLTRTIQRAGYFLSAATVALGLLIYAIAGATSHVAVFVLPDGEPALTAAEDLRFRIDVDSSEKNAESYEVNSKSELRIPFAPIEQNTRIVITAIHPEYEDDEKVGSFRELSRETVSMKPAAHPALVVGVHLENELPESTESFRVQAWVTGKTESAMEKGLTSAGHATFIAKKTTHWRVQVNDDARERVHYSPDIWVDGKRHSYPIDLKDEETYKWRPEVSAKPSDPKTLKVLPSDFLASLDPVQRGSSTETVGFEIPLEADLVTSPILYPVRVRTLLPFGAPSKGHLLVRVGYVVSYNPKLKVPNWVAYQLRVGSTELVSRRRPFVSDPDLDPSLRASMRAYRRSTYDRGHLVSVADMHSIGEQAIREAFYLSVVAPQTPVLNRHTWRNIERMARAYVVKEQKEIHITAGPIFLGKVGNRETEKHL